MLKGWLASDIASIEVLENFPSDTLRSLPIDLNPSTVTINESQTVILAVKPQNYREVLDEHQANIHPEAMVISILAGISIEALQNVLPKRSIVRAMPNTPATVGQGLTALCAADDISDANKNVATSLMQAVGEIVWVENESMMDSVTAVSGSGPAYLFYLGEQMVMAAMELGFSESEASQIVQQTIFGSAQLWLHSGESPGTLRQRVTSPGGSTAAAIEKFNDLKLSLGIQQGIHQAFLRAVELSKT